MNRKSILIVDDEPKILILLKDYLSLENFDIYTANNGREALEIFEDKKFDLIILDVMMPEIDGWTICREIRKKDKEIIILMLTARGEDYDEIHGFEIGADDYVKKPIRPSTLVARINALFRRLNNMEEENNIIKIRGLQLDKNTHIIKIDEEEIILSPKEYEMFLLLLESQGKIVSREQLLNKIWGYDYFGETRTVDTHINRLRNKIEPYEDIIVTVRGFGYRIEE